MMYVLLKSWYQNKKQEWYVTDKFIVNVGDTVVFG